MLAILFARPAVKFQSSSSVLWARAEGMVINGGTRGQRRRSQMSNFDMDPNDGDNGNVRGLLFTACLIAFIVLLVWELVVAS